jgi:hypothetical protein
LKGFDSLAVGNQWIPATRSQDCGVWRVDLIG